MNVLFLENIHPSAVKELELPGVKVKTMPAALSEPELTKAIADTHVIGIRSKTQLTAAAIESAPELLGIGCFCIGTNQVDLDAARLKGIPVFNAPFSNTRSVAELIMAEIVSLARQLGDRNREAHEGKWLKVSQGCHEVRGKTLGIIGYGHIGSQVSILAESFGMKVLFYDVISTMPLGNSDPCASLKELLQASDFVTLHVPETPATKGMIGAAEMAQMKKGSYLLNASRGTVVDLEALAHCIRTGHLAGAAVDVYPVEPESKEQKLETPLRGLPNVILTPHIGGSTEEAQAKIGVEVSQALSKFLKTGATRGSVNFPQVDLPVLEKAHRILNVHQNVPGVLKEINGVFSDLGANIRSQVLATDSDIGYLIVDLDQALSESVNDRLRKLPTSIRTRILY
jgi:D-3-phosphoglycerate dehydrogenase